MSKVKKRVCDICGEKVDPNGYGFFTFPVFIFPARRFYKKKFNDYKDKNETYPKDMCEKCFNKFIKFCMQEREEYDEEE